jgi:hypothetical protein
MKEETYGKLRAWLELGWQGEKEEREAIVAGSASLDFIFLFFIYSHVHTLFRPFLLPAPSPTLFPPPPSLPSRTYSAFISNFV